MKKPDDPLSSATMQIDVRDLELRAPSEPPKSRKTPPPLPPLGLSPAAAAAAAASAPAPAPAPAPAAPKSAGRVAIYGALFLAFLAAAIFGGMKVGLALRGPAAAPSASAPGAATTEPAIISIPTVEVAGPPDAQ
jgi:hypothetical protein